MITVNNKKLSTYKCVIEICLTGNINSDERSGISNPNKGKLENILKIAISSITNNLISLIYTFWEYNASYFA